MKKQIKKTVAVAMAALALSTGGVITKELIAEAATTYKRTINVSTPTNIPAYNGYKVSLVTNGKEQLLGTVDYLGKASGKFNISVSGTAQAHIKVCFRLVGNKSTQESAFSNGCINSPKFSVNESTFKSSSSKMDIKVTKSGAVYKVSTSISK